MGQLLAAESMSLSICQAQILQSIQLNLYGNLLLGMIVLLMLEGFLQSNLCCAGLGQLLVSGKSMEKHGATWLAELKRVAERK